MIEAMLDGVVDDDETVHRYLDNSRVEIEHLSGLIDDLFELAQLDVGAPADQYSTRVDPRFDLGYLGQHATEGRRARHRPSRAKSPTMSI